MSAQKDAHINEESHRVVECVLTSHRRKVDKSLSISLATVYEASNDLAAWLDRHHMSHLKVGMTEDLQATSLSYRGQRDEKGATPSQRLRNGIYRYWEHLRSRGETEMELQLFYQTEMENIISQYA